MRAFAIMLALLSLLHAAWTDIVIENISSAFAVENLTCENAAQPTWDNPVTCASLYTFTLFPRTEDAHVTCDLGPMLAWMPALKLEQEIKHTWRDEHNCFHERMAKLESQSITLRVMAKNKSVETKEHIVNLSALLKEAGYAHIRLEMHANFTYKITEKDYEWHCQSNGSQTSCSCSILSMRSEEKTFSFNDSKGLYAFVECGKPRFFVQSPPLLQYFAGERGKGKVLIFSNRRLQRWVVRTQKEQEGNWSQVRIGEICSPICFKVGERNGAEPISVARVNALFSEGGTYRYIYQVEFPFSKNLSVKVCDEFGFCFSWRTHFAAVNGSKNIIAKGKGMRNINTSLLTLLVAAGAMGVAARAVRILR